MEVYMAGIGKAFWTWYNETSKTSGALVTPSMAGKMMGTTRQYIQNLMYQEKLTKYEFDGMIFIGMNELNEAIVKRQERILQAAERKLPRIAYISAKEEKEKELEEMIKYLKEHFPEQAEKWGM